jgi:uncharacterized membrane protein
MADRSSTALVHFYRGELGRLAIYRVRLDTTTNWAIGVVVAVLTFALGQPEAPHTLLLLPYLLTTVFLFIESRRFQELDMLRQRVRTMETAYFVPLFRGEPVLPDEQAEALAKNLEAAEPTLPLRDALANRVRRNYLWLYLANFGGWGIKLYLDHVSTVDDLALGRIPGWVVALLVVAGLAPWFVLAVLPPRTD